jgi:hypothetical protein
VRPYFENKNKRAGGVAQVIEYLPSKLEALDSIPRTIKNRCLHLKYMRNKTQKKPRKGYFNE